MNHGTGSYHQRDRTLDADRQAYKRLRQNGLQPKRLDGSAKLEATAATEAQVEGRPA